MRRYSRDEQRDIDNWYLEKEREEERLQAQEEYEEMRQKEFRKKCTAQSFEEILVLFVESRKAFNRLHWRLDFLRRETQSSDDDANTPYMYDCYCELYDLEEPYEKVCTTHYILARVLLSKWMKQRHSVKIERDNR